MATEQNQKGTAKKAGLLGVIGLLVLKFKFAIFTALKALSLFKFGWLFSGAGSMLMSVGLYSMMFGWRYAIMLVVLIYIHEMGHYIWMKFYGLKPKAPVFVPFLGAYTAMTNMPGDLATHAWVAWAGPFVGGLAAVASYYLGVSTGNVSLIAAANTGAILNLLQLVPVRPFDGGFIVQSISRWLFIPGAILLVFVAWSFHSVLLIIIAGVSIFAMLRGGMTPALAQAPASPGQRFLIAAAYLLLAFGLAYLHWISTAQTQSLMHRG